MEHFGNILCLTYAELTDGNPADSRPERRPILTEASLKYYRQRGKLTISRRGCYNTPALIAYHSLPEAIKERVIAKYGDPLNDTRRTLLRTLIERDPQAEHFYNCHTFGTSGTTHLPAHLIEQYTMNASALNGLLRLVADRTLCLSSYGKNLNRIWPEAAKDMAELQAELGCRLPINYLSLRRVAERYSAEGYAALISGKHGNSNAASCKKREQDSILKECLGDGRNLNYTTVAEAYNSVAARYGWKAITSATVANYLKKHPECFAGRFGAKALANQKLMQVKRTAPTAPLYFWCVDGWDSELLYKRKDIDPKTGHALTSYHHRPTVVAIVDPFNGYIVGYAIGTHESPALIRKAFRNAFEHTRQLLGGYFKPWQLQTDNYKRGTLLSFYEACTHYYTPAAVGNAKAKMIEPFFNRFNNQYLRLMPNSSGHGVKSRASKQVSDDWIESHKRHFPDYAGCCDQLEKAIALDRQGKQAAFLSGWNALPEEKRLAFSTEDFLYAFGETVAPRRLNADGLRFQMEGNRFVYDCFNPEFRHYGHLTFFLRYNPEAMDTVLAIENAGTEAKPREGTRRFLLERKYEQPMALMDRRPGDAEALQRVRDYNKNMKEEIILKRQDSGECVRDFFDQHPDMRNTLAAHIITDSRGQHKDTRNAVAGRSRPVALPVPTEESWADDGYELLSAPHQFLNDF